MKWVEIGLSGIVGAVLTILFQKAHIRNSNKNGDGNIQSGSITVKGGDGGESGPGGNAGSGGGAAVGPNAYAEGGKGGRGYTLLEVLAKSSLDSKSSFPELLEASGYDISNPRDVKRLLFEYGKGGDGGDSGEPRQHH